MVLTRYFGLFFVLQRYQGLTLRFGVRLIGSGTGYLGPTDQEIKPSRSTSVYQSSNRHFRITPGNCWDSTAAGPKSLGEVGDLLEGRIWTIADDLRVSGGSAPSPGH